MKKNRRMNHDIHIPGSATAEGKQRLMLKN